jgi:hypothetical protein
MRILLLVLSGLLALVALVWIVGALLPREHRAACRIALRAEPGRVIALLSEVEAYPRWRDDLKAVRPAEPIAGRSAYLEDSEHGEILYVLEESRASERRVVRIADDSLPFGGTWTFELAPHEGGTRLTLTEDGLVRPALFRALSRFVFGHHATMERYLGNVARALGESAPVERVL